MFFSLILPELRIIDFWGFEAYSWRITLWMGEIASFVFILWLSRYFSLKKKKIILIFLWQFVLMYIFSKMFFFLSHNFLHNDGANFKITEFWRAGRIYAGTLTGFFLATVTGVFLLKESRKFWSYLDLFLLGHLILLFFYRIGNILNRSHIGKPTDMPWGVEYHGQIRHETSTYEALSLFLLFWIVIFLFKKMKNLPGTVSLFILGWMALSRFITDFFRSYDLPVSNFHFQNGLTLNQIFYFSLFLFSAGWLIKKASSR